MIPTIRGAELHGMADSEECCFCWTHTRYWTELPDRTPRQQVPCCEACGRKAAPVMVPSLKAYAELAYARAIVALRLPRASARVAAFLF